MARKLIASLAVAGSLALAGSAWAQAGGGAGGSSGGTGSGSGAGSSTPVEQGSWHRVESVDSDGGTVKVVDGDALTVDKSTRVTRDGVAVSIADVQPGDEVRASYLHGKHEGPIAELAVRSRENLAPVPSSK